MPTCRACGDPNGRRYNCCTSKPILCNTCKDLHDRRVHRGRSLDDDEPGDEDEVDEHGEDWDEDADLWHDEETEEA